MQSTYSELGYNDDSVNSEEEWKSQIVSVPCIVLIPVTENFSLWKKHDLAVRGFWCIVRNKHKIFLKIYTSYLRTKIQIEFWFKQEQYHWLPCRQTELLRPDLNLTSCVLLIPYTVSIGTVCSNWKVFLYLEGTVRPIQPLYFLFGVVSLNCFRVSYYVTTTTVLVCKLDTWIIHFLSREKMTRTDLFHREWKIGHPTLKNIGKCSLNGYVVFKPILINWKKSNLKIAGQNGALEILSCKFSVIK